MRGVGGLENPVLRMALRCRPEALPPGLLHGPEHVGCLHCDEVIQEMLMLMEVGAGVK